MIEHRGSSFISVSQWRGVGDRGQRGERRGYCYVLRGSEGPALLLNVYLSKGSPTASPTLADSVNVLTLFTSPGTLGPIHTLKEVQQQCQGGRGRRRRGAGGRVDRTCEATYGQP